MPGHRFHSQLLQATFGDTLQFGSRCPPSESLPSSVAFGKRGQDAEALADPDTVSGYGIAFYCGK